jgi:hypothetical protein
MCNVDGHPCMTSISVAEIEAAVDRAMAGQDGSATIIKIS